MTKERSELESLSSPFPSVFRMEVFASLYMFENSLPEKFVFVFVLCDLGVPLETELKSRLLLPPA